MRELLRFAWLGLLLGAPFLPSGWAVTVLVAVLVFWLTRRPPRREVVVVTAALLLATIALGVRWIDEVRARAVPAQWSERAAGEYARLWEGLRGDAAAAAAALGRPPADLRAKLAAFRRLDQFESGSARGRRALLLVDPDGAAAAWAGEGLLHELDPERVPRAGLSYQASFGAVTLLAVEPLPSDRQVRRPWRVVAGASFPTDVLPIPAAPRRLRWALVDGPAQALSGTVAVELAGAPTMVIGKPSRSEAPEPPWTLPVAWIGIAFALIALAVVRGVALVLPHEPRSGHLERRDWVVVLFLAGVFASGEAASLPLGSLALLVGGLGLAAAGLAALGLAAAGAEDEKDFKDFKDLEDDGGNRGPRPWALMARGVVAALFLAGGAWLLQGRAPFDLSAAIVVEPRAFSARAAFAAAAFGLFCLAGRRRPRRMPLPRDRWAWAGMAALVAGAALADLPWAALPCLAAGGAAAAVYADRRRLREGLALAGLALLAIAAAAATWEVVYRMRLREQAAGVLLDQLVPPPPAQRAALLRELDAHFAGRDLGELAPRTPAGLNRQDLAYTLWRGSPLARLHVLSALAVVPREGAASSFSFGLPSARGGRLDWTQERWTDLTLPLWGSSLVTGEAAVRFAGQPWGTVRYWLMPRPGFRAGDERRVEDVEIGLLKGGPEAAPFDVEEPVLYALYGKDGRAALSPWEEAPPLSRELRRPPGRPAPVARVDTPTGPARAYVRAGDSGWEVVYVPDEAPLTALERVANSSVGVLLLLALSAPPILLLALPRASFRDALYRTVRSYSKRLILVYTVLLLVPLLLLNAVLVRSMGDRLRQQQRDAGGAALTAAQKVLGERLLNQPPGFGVDTALGDRLLGDLSEVVHHEMNLYYGSGIYASSKHELFAAGLLPNRIPGEIYSRLSLLGYGLSSRTNRVADATYLEIYAPLRLPGVAGGEDRLFLSMPLLAQQEEASRELAHLRRHGLLVTLCLFVLLVAVGTRLARNFTQPITELVAGTRRIAAGAPSLELSPGDVELAALVEAVDEMARRLAEGRERLVREKHVVERMVENITSGVVSLDGDGRVLMHNRVAAELLGAQVAEPLEAAVAGKERLAPVAAFLRASGLHKAEMARETVRLSGSDGVEREWSLVWVPLLGSGEPSALLVVEDATEVLRSQRVLAWAEMARIIAHEIKNPLTPIRLSAEHMREVWQRDPAGFGGVFERCTVNILAQVEELRSIASEFSTYSAILRIDPKPGDLTAAIADLVEGYRAAPPGGVVVEIDAAGPIPARFDARLLGRAVRNLLENALRAAGAGGNGDGEVRVRVEVDREGGLARIAVLDNGPGVRPENLTRIFDPYFSTHDTGTGLGLPIARRVVEEHGGHIAARNRPEGGLEVVITLPVQPPAA